MISRVQAMAGMGLGVTLQYPDQTAALQLGHFATKSVLGSHVTRVLAGTGTEADPGLSSLPLSEAVRNAARRCWSGAADHEEKRTKAVGLRRKR
jgi:hypothetical protein